MRRFIRTAAILTLLGLGIYGYKKNRIPDIRAKMPTTRYHGYDINRQAIARAKAFTVLISNEGIEGVGRGTGVLIDAKHVLTCAHMVRSPQDDLWIFPSPIGVVAKGKPIFVGRSVDLAILELDKPINLAHYATFTEAHYDGEPITIIGNTKGLMMWFVSFGIISGSEGNFLLTDGTLYGGNSGGPWINEKGEIVALTDWTLVYNGVESGIHGGVSAKTINEFLGVWKSPINLLFQMLQGG